MATNPVGRPAKIDKEELLDVAQRLFAEKGFFGTSTRDLSKVAGCNIAMISYHFGGKEGLYEAVLLRHFQRTKTRYLSTASEPKAWPEFRDPMKRQLCSSLFEFARAAILNTEMQKILCREMMSGGKKLVSALTKSEAGVTGALQASLESLKSRKKLKSDLDLRFGGLSLLAPIIYSCIAAPILKEIYGFKNLDEAYARTLSVHLTRTFFDGWGTGGVS